MAYCFITLVVYINSCSINRIQDVIFCKSENLFTIVKIRVHASKILINIFITKRITACGKSRIIWPELLGHEYNPESLLPVIEHCGGVCGTAILDEGDLYYQPFVGIGFNLAGENNDGNIATADAAGMGGICITYSSDAAPTLEMSLGDHLDATLEYALPAVALPKSPSGTTRFIPCPSSLPWSPSSW